MKRHRVLCYRYIATGGGWNLNQIAPTPTVQFVLNVVKGPHKGEKYKLMASEIYIAAIQPTIFAWIKTKGQSQALLNTLYSTRPHNTTTR